MKKKLKLILTSLFVLIILSVAWFNLFFISSNADSFKERLDSLGKNSDIVIIFNSGGWGTVSFERAFDFNPVINNIKNLLENKKYKVSTISYYRTESNFLAQTASIGEIVSGYPETSKNLATIIDNFIINYPGKKIILAGLSNGASLVDSVMEDVGHTNNVIGLEFGTPFSGNKIEKENVLVIKNGQDALAQGDLGLLILAAIKSPFVYTASILNGKYISYGEAVKINGHDYSWTVVKSEIISFLESKIN